MFTLYCLDMNNIIIVYITCPTQEKAQEIALHLLEKQLIACANIVPIQSMFKWEGAQVQEPEVLLITKTLEHNYDVIKQEVKKIHPYEIPCIIKISAEANEQYLAFIQNAIVKS